jgi:ribosomal protein L11 methyltransferase
MAFGSGSHTTTRLMLRQFLSSNLKGKRVLDVGCGTGILGIGAMLAGASHLTAVDIDNNSVENTIDHLRLNGIEGSEVKEGGIEKVGADERFDVILSNIHLNIHLSLMESYTAHLADGGRLHLSGFFAEEQVMLQDSAASHGLVLTAVLEEEGWCCMEFQLS